MDRTPPYLAALASSAVPGLDPVSVEALPSTPDQDFDVAFVQDTQHRRWVIRAPRSAASGAQMDLTINVLGPLGRRLPFSVPAPKGFIALKEGGRAVVYPYLPGHNLDYAELPSGPGLAAELGRAIAALHNTDPQLFDELGLPSYDADGYRTRRLTDLDRAAQTGRVPTALLERWERALEDVALWRFAPVATHGDLTGDQVLAVFEDDADAATGKIRGITGWEDAKVADPADDFAPLVRDASAETLETVLEAYAHARVDRPDANLLVRARLASELLLLGELMRAIAREDDDAADVLTTQLRRLDDHVHAEEEASNDYRRTSLAPVQVRERQTPPPAVVEEDDSDDDVAFETSPAAEEGPDPAEDSRSGPAKAPEADDHEGDDGGDHEGDDGGDHDVADSGVAAVDHVGVESAGGATGDEQGEEPGSRTHADDETGAVDTDREEPSEADTDDDRRENHDHDHDHADDTDDEDEDEATMLGRHRGASPDG